MIDADVRYPSSLARAMRMGWCALVLLAMTGCAIFPAPAALERASTTPEVLACIDWFAALDTHTESAGVRDVGAVRVPSFAQLRVDRFTASMRVALTASVVPTAGAADASAVAVLGSPLEQATLVQRMQQLDAQARGYEIANLPSAARQRLAGSASSNPADLVQRTQDCAARLNAFDLASPARMTSLLARLNVPDDYATSARLLGLYALSRLPFAMGVRQHEAQRLAVFAQREAPSISSTRLRLSPPARPPAASMTPTHIARMLAPAPNDPFQIPAPSANDLELLYAHYAPRFDIDIASDDDKPGAITWQGDALTVDTKEPVLYRHTAYTRYGKHTLLQLVYTLWFPARPPAPGNPSDMLAGALDGLVFRVTLAPDGTPLVYDSMHPCGCYHEFYPTPAATPKATPAPLIEWAFSPQTLPAIGPQDQIVIRVAARTHYIDRISVEPALPSSSDAHYAWRDYHSLRSLPIAGTTTSTPGVNAATADALSAQAPERRSVFGPDGFVAGTDRAERYLFWPMGVQRAGAMRQWGHHATAFVGRRHFDDAQLMEQRFTFDLLHFRP
jgi:hypothetical protein